MLFRSLIDYDNDDIIDFAITNEVGYAIVNKNDSAKNIFTLKDVNGAVTLKDVTGATITFDNSTANKDNYAKYLSFDGTVAANDVVAITADISAGKLVYNISKVEGFEGNVAAVNGTKFTDLHHYCSGHRMM